MPGVAKWEVFGLRLFLPLVYVRPTHTFVVTPIGSVRLDLSEPVATLLLQALFAAWTLLVIAGAALAVRRCTRVAESAAAEASQGHEPQAPHDSDGKRSLAARRRSGLRDQG